MRWKIRSSYPPEIEIDGKVLSPESRPESEKEEEIIEVLKVFDDNPPFGRSIALYELQLWDALNSLLEEGDGKDSE